MHESKLMKCNPSNLFNTFLLCINGIFLWIPRGEGGKKEISDVCRMKIKNNKEHLTTSVETQCLSKVWKTEKKKIRQGTSKRKQIEKYGREKKENNLKKA